MQGYWQQVLSEVLNKEKRGRDSVFTNMSAVQSCVEEVVVKKKRFLSGARSAAVASVARKQGPRGVVVYLGSFYPGVYFTCRESHCALLLLKGLTIREMGRYMQLSARTVEYYVENMKSKLSCKRKSELVQAILSSNFLSELSRLAEESAELLS